MGNVKKHFNLDTSLQVRKNYVFNWQLCNFVEHFEMSAIGFAY